MEAIVEPISWVDCPEASRSIFGAMRSPAGEEIVLEKNVSAERVLPASILRTLTENEMDEYRRFFLNLAEDRRPTLTWPREILIDRSPQDVAAIVDSYSRRPATCHTAALHRCRSRIHPRWGTARALSDVAEPD
jgi:haloalkane dehalogenase